MPPCWPPPPTGSGVLDTATESLLVHASAADALLPVVASALGDVEIRGDLKVCETLGGRAKAATEADWDEEHLDLTLSVKVVAGLDEAIDHINRHGTGHTEAIVTADIASAARFQREVDAAVVNVNASTRFADGEEFGFGAEIGISTQKLHARGPMGLSDLGAAQQLRRREGSWRQCAAGERADRALEHELQLWGLR
jgi:glutamate-5-semialdehyde dehydrogenase